MGAAKKPVLCNLGLIVQHVLAKRHHPSYVAEKVRDLDGLSAPDVLAWSVVYLDPENQCALSQALGFEDRAMATLRRVFEVARHARLVTKEVPPCSSQ